MLAGAMAHRERGVLSGRGGAMKARKPTRASAGAPPKSVAISWCPSCGHFALNPGKNPAPICADPACGCRCKFRRIQYGRAGQPFCPSCQTPWDPQGTSGTTAGQANSETCGPCGAYVPEPEWRGSGNVSEVIAAVGRVAVAARSGTADDRTRAWSNMLRAYDTFVGD